MKRGARWASRAAAACILTLALATLACRLGNGLSWRLDLASGFAGVMAAGCAVGAAVLMALRYRKLALPVALLACAHLVWMAWGRAPHADPVPGRTLRVMTFNSLGVNTHGDAVVAAIERSDADLVCILEASWHTVRAIRASGVMEERYPYRILPEDGKEWGVAVLSRYPMSVDEVRDEHWDRWWDYYNYRRFATVHAPWGDFLHAMLIPSSPRSPDRWRMGNALLEDNIEILRAYYLPKGLPMVVTADLNASPTMWRTGRVRRALGLHRCKPLWGVRGTWPAKNPAWKRFSIDDVFVSRGIGVSSWRVMEGETGSDHAPVVVDLVMPAAPPSAGR